MSNRSLQSTKRQSPSVSVAPSGRFSATSPTSRSASSSPGASRRPRKGRALPPVGTGPFVLKEWVPGDRVTLVAFPEHWRGAPKIDVLIFKPIPDGSSRAIALETGVADIAYPLDPVHLMRLRDRPGVFSRHSRSKPAGDLRRTQSRPAAARRARVPTCSQPRSRCRGDHQAPPLRTRPASRLPARNVDLGSRLVSPYQFDPRKAREMLASVAGPVEIAPSNFGVLSPGMCKTGRWPRRSQAISARSGWMCESGCLNGEAT